MKKKSSKKPAAAVDDLKRLVSSLNSQMDASSLEQIKNRADLLAGQPGQDKIQATFAKMVKALSNYMLSNIDSMHDDALPLLASLIKNMVSFSSEGSNLQATEKQALLSKEMTKFNDLKKRIQQAGKSTPSSGASGGPSIDNLKAIILSLDWEISDEIIQKLHNEIESLKKLWHTSKIHVSFLKMFQSIATYINNKGADTHPDAISFLSTLYDNFEQVANHPELSKERQQEILSREFQKFNGLKEKISARSALRQPVSALSPMDDLIGTKATNQSPVDDLIEELHMLQDDGPSQHHSAGASSAPANPDVREVIPDRMKNQPIPEIQTRLDAFFNEDESLDQFGFADSGEEVVPYKESQAGSAKPSPAPPRPSSPGGTAAGAPPYTAAGAPPSPSLPDFTPDFTDDDTAEVVPYEFEEDIFEEMADDEPEKASRTPDKIAESAAIDTELIEMIRSTLSRSGGTPSPDDLESLNNSLEAIEHQLSEARNRGTDTSESQALVELFKSYRDSLDIVSKYDESKDMTRTMARTVMEEMIFCLDCLKRLHLSDPIREPSPVPTLAGACIRHIKFHQTLVSILSRHIQGRYSHDAGSAMAQPGPGDAALVHGGPGMKPDDHAHGEVLSGAEIINNGPEGDETFKKGEDSGEASQNTPPTGFWAKLKKILGMS
ncbi:MAG: hypothetical protein HQK66_05160 [Desulfamplus sp.]|nr:hypothetical protein [Desulfamplus sp.]